MVGGGGGGGGGKKKKKKKKAHTQKKNGDQIINHSRQCCIHSHVDTRRHTHTHSAVATVNHFSDVINDDTGICIASTSLQSKMMGVGGRGGVS